MRTARKDGGRFMTPGLFLPAGLRGRASIIEANRVLMLGRALAHTLASLTRAVSPKTFFITTNRGGARNLCFTFFRIGTGQEKRDGKSTSGVSPIFPVSSCS